MAAWRMEEGWPFADGSGVWIMQLQQGYHMISIQLKYDIYACAIITARPWFSHHFPTYAKNLVHRCCISRASSWCCPLSPPIVQCPEQERFIAYKTKTVRKEDKKVTDLTVGWYSKEDMSKILKWNSNHGRNSLQRLQRCLAIAVSSVYILKTLSFRVLDHVGCLGFLGKRLPEPSRSVSRIACTWSGFQDFLISWSC